MSKIEPSRGTSSRAEMERSALVSFRDLKLSVADLIKTTEDSLKVDVNQGIGERTVRVTWLGAKGHDVPVDRMHVVHALGAVLDRQLDVDQLRNWSELLIMLDDCFIFATEAGMPGQRVIPDVLHSLANNDPASLDDGGLSYLKQCLLYGTIPDPSLM